MANRYPKLVAFDLDYTLWDLYIDTHVSGPLKREGQALNKVKDRYGTIVSFYPHVPQILHRLRSAEVTIAACSRTDDPPMAREALSLLLMPPSKAEPDEVPMVAERFFDEMEIYPTSKLKHFKELHKKTGLPYTEMLFFDDERRNKEVESLGVTMHLIRDGVDDRAFEAGLAEWRRRHPEEVNESPAEAS